LSSTPPSTKYVSVAAAPASSYSRKNSPGNDLRAESGSISEIAVGGKAPGKHEVARALKASAGA
jgi:hypothetical protein